MVGRPGSGGVLSPGGPFDRGVVRGQKKTGKILSLHSDSDP